MRAYTMDEIKSEGKGTRKWSMRGVRGEEDGLEGREGSPHLGGRPRWKDHDTMHIPGVLNLPFLFGDVRSSYNLCSDTA